VKEININDLDLSNIGAWPTAVKVALIIVAAVGVAVGGFFLFVQGQIETLERVEKTGFTLKVDFETKRAKAVKLEAYKRRLTEIEEPC